MDLHTLEKAFIDLGKKYTFTATELLLRYTDCVEPYLGIISHNMLEDNGLTQEGIRSVLGVTIHEWSAMKQLFEPLSKALNGGNAGLDFKAQVILQRAIALNPKSEKLVETYLKRYDPNYKPRGREADDIELPKTLDVTVSYARKEEEDFAEIDDANKIRVEK